MLAYVLDHTGPYIVLDQPPYAIHIGHEFGSALDGERTRARQRDIDGLLDAAGPPRQHQHPVRQEYGLVDLVGDEEHGLAASSQMRISSVCMISRVWASSAENGSSMRRMSGSIASARERLTRWRMPPDSWRGK